MKFSRGDLVVLSPLCGGAAELSSTPVFLTIDDNQTVGHFFGSDVAIVIDANMNDCSSIMVLTNRSVGWIASAWVRRLI